MLSKLYVKIRCKFFILFNFFAVRKFKDTLIKQGFKRISEFKRNSWHDGFIYFTAYFNGNKRFVKCSYFYNEIKNETYFSGRLSQLSLTNKIIKIDNVTSSFGVIIEMPFIESECSFFELTDFQYKSLIDDVSKINKSGVILRDFKPENIIVSNGYIYLIDFTFCYSLDGSIVLRSPYIKNRLGAKCRPDGCWDDAYTLCHFLEQTNAGNQIIEYAKRNIAIYRLSVDGDQLC